MIGAYPRGGFIKSQEDIRSLLDVDAHDCEWIGENLATNSTSGGFLLKFSELPKRPAGELSADYWKIYEKAKRKQPESKKIASEMDGQIPYIWVAGEKLFKLYEAGEITIESIDDDETSKAELNHLNFPNTLIENDSFATTTAQRILAARTSLFGTVAEVGDSLYSITENGVELASHRPVSWRVFPRAKNYLNQLHIIENEALIVRAYSSKQSTNNINKFGITFDEVI